MTTIGRERDAERAERPERAGPARHTATAVLGVDVGGTDIKWVRWANASVVNEGSLPTPRLGPDSVVTAIAHLVGTQPPVGALGVAVPGHLGRDGRSTRLVPNVPGEWAGYPLADRLRDVTEVPTALLNDARAFARAELALGAARDRSEAVFVTMGTGIGGALALGGAVLRGPGDRLGEIGHMPAVADGTPCGCGARGCLETVAGGRALARAWDREGGSAAPDTAVSGAAHLVAAARVGDPGALRILADAGDALGRVLGGALALLGFRTVVIGGGVAPAFEFMRAETARALTGRGPLVGWVDLRLAALGTRAGAVGAALEAASLACSASPYSTGAADG
ncbi:ROK family protein [Embleya hyalina]|uniref:Glucokinase n=1 Tax=Embleya hyalina TaxID=516124 RepID=A0A401Z5U2_9ACTN|nr:ROK family protein [Embleya hyalina]GCE02221.1 glucokinase [Embleya hyalina]